MIAKDSLYIIKLDIEKEKPGGSVFETNCMDLLPQQHPNDLPPTVTHFKNMQQAFLSHSNVFSSNH